MRIVSTKLRRLLAAIEKIARLEGMSEPCLKGEKELTWVNGDRMVEVLVVGRRMFDIEVLLPCRC